MLKKIFSSRQAVIRLIATLAILLIFAGTRFVPQVSGYEGDFFYPLVLFYSTPLVFIVILSLFAVIFWDISPIYLGGAFSKAIIIGFALIPCAFLIIVVYVWYFLAADYAPLPPHFKHTSFEDHIYYLAWDNTPYTDLGSSHNRYLIYRCDNLGLMCHEIGNFNGYDYEAVSGNHVQSSDVYFIREADHLALQIGTEIVTVSTNRH